jgi:hypothetical protein
MQASELTEGAHYSVGPEIMEVLRTLDRLPMRMFSGDVVFYEGTNAHGTHMFRIGEASNIGYNPTGLPFPLTEDVIACLHRE